MILLDTVTFLWIINDSDKLSQKAKDLYLNQKNKIFLSSISFWEIIVKFHLKRLPLPQKPGIYIPKQRKIHGITSISLEESDVQKLERLPTKHNDPFDRMLICQALNRKLTILTPDKLISAYPVKTIW